MGYAHNVQQIQFGMEQTVYAFQVTTLLMDLVNNAQSTQPGMVQHVLA
jgi:hypothetical protein